MSKCIFCGMNAILNKQDNAGRTIYNCRGCGVFVISDVVQADVIANKEKIGAFMVHRNLMGNDDTLMISLDNVPADKGYTLITVEQIVKCFPSSYHRRMELTLENLVNKSEYPGYEIKVESLRSAPLLYLDNFNFDAMSFAISALEGKGYVTIKHYGSSSSFFPCGIVVTPDGWEAATRQEPEKRALRPAFIFAPDLGDETGAYIDAAVRVCRKRGFTVSALTAQNVASVGDRLSAEVRGCEYVVCDLSAPLPEAYFVTGMAVALGLPLILTCKAKNKDRLKIETQQLGVMLWEDTDGLGELIDNAIRARVYGHIK